MLGLIGTVVSCDKIVKDSKTLRWLQREFSALATEMEGAAVGYTCGLSDVPFVVIRGISDGAGEMIVAAGESPKEARQWSPPMGESPDSESGDAAPPC